MAEGGPAAQLKESFLKLYTNRPKPQPISTQYEKKPSIQNAFLLAGQSAIAGAVVAGLRNALSGRNGGFVTPIGLFAAVGASFAFTESVVANQRQTDDAISAASGACAAGFLLGISAARSLPMAVGACSVMAGFTGLHKYSGGMQQHQPDPAAEKKSFFKPTAIVEATKRE
ncbi:hypothetical protein DFH08DRAFT_954590 [Mycena albidolilacea]|uniref:NADH dehydrogenase [ubiquinone] 1 alpha subcomplex subunit 11 n=1 Tax=Mycena albidolilacea TaxID=1033008 RepID=A0AAD7AG79_9AGAR|nr:hypothetical protein DFH08DRAFT_954590 [Mycena albidolilacea]